MDVSETPRTGLPLRSRLAAASPWPRKRIVGEAVLALALSGTAALLHATSGGSVVAGVALVLGTAVLSLARRALPATVLLISSALAGSIVGMFALLICASWSAGSRIKRPARAVAAYTAGLALYFTLTVLTADEEELGLSLLLTAVLSVTPFLVLAVVPGLASRYRAQRHALLDALQRHNAQLVREQAMVARQARLLERQRIAQDMHDSLGHQLALITVHAGALEVDPDLSDRQREGVGILREASRTAMRELREAVGILRDDAGAPEPDREDTEPSAARVAASVDRLVEASRAAGAKVELLRSGTERPLAPAADHAVYRIAQEGLTNAHKHAPGAPITVALRYEPDSLVVEVANGPVPAGAPAGPPAISGGQGLAGLEERARLVGGMVHRGPTPDGGFRLAGVLPYGSGETVARPGAATSVAAGEDFRRQSGEGLAGHGGGVIEHRSDPQKEFAAIMSSKKNVALGCALTAVVLVVGVGALLVWGVSKLLDEVEKGVIPASVYESAEVGDAEADLRKKFPEGGSLLTDGVEKDGPPLPENADCEHFVDDEEDIVYRFCFRDGKLSSKESYPHKI
ncbi:MULTISPECIES: sensor histidine kinase [unclassified Streptomyces]|uniref:sensor histidine kinase n=1 Tax=unclassified Streptomyces TaxID=2593676 RepID=UPI000F6C592E|nr:MULTISPECIES: histidine kinase [unclassified Streptomyces]AZM62991.1 two-component sensor histidine kinase [Streptomyces sp. WAC 01438]RSM99311.1 two-component sensor histidine kinase [Streptomyces sp. WAC 01420]